MTSTRIRCYSELRRLLTFEERFDYLVLGGAVGSDTFGFDRWVNQSFYQSREWKNVRRDVIARDEACDLGIEEYTIFGGLTVHHMNPMQVQDIDDALDWILDPEYLICTSHATHNLIHYGDRTQIRKPYRERSPGDTNLWSRR